jgi:hypothetical protein
MKELSSEQIEKSYSTCRFADEYFGDCCHPNGGVSQLVKAVEQCIRKDYAWWEPSKRKIN